MKVSFVGEASVGKTSIIEKQLGNSLIPSSTIGFESKKMTVDNEEFTVYDTAGQEVYHSMTINEIRNSSIFVIVFDVTSTESFKKIEEYWLKFINQIELPSYFVIVGNKSDLEGKRKVTFQQGVDLSNKIIEDYYKQSDIDNLSEVEKRSTYIETSALTGNGIEILFSIIAQKLKNVEKEKIESVDLTTKDPKEQKKCSC